MPPVFKRDVELELPVGHELARLRDLDKLLTDAAKDLGKGRAQVRVEAEDGAEYKGDSLARVLEELQGDFRAPSTVWFASRVGSIGDYNFAAYADITDRSVGVDLAAADEGWVRQTEGLINRAWVQWNQGLPVRHLEFLGFGASVGPASGSSSPPSDGLLSTPAPSRWSRVKKVWIGVGAVVAFLAGIATIVQTFK